MAGEIYSEFLDELLSNIRARPISWEAQQRSGVIDDSQVKTVKTIDKQRRDKRIDIVSKAFYVPVDADEGWRTKVCKADGDIG
jgi:fido (protein-threonine AMPylation protein)